LIAIDASISLAWFMKDEATEATTSVLHRVMSSSAVAPTLWRLEVLNAMQVAIRRKRISKEERDIMLGNLGQMPIHIDDAPPDHAWTTILQLSDDHVLTAYDASYLELAIQRQLPLATLDRQLADAARAAGIEVLP